VYLAWQFLKSGLLKIGDWDATLSLFHEEYSVPVLSPDVAAYMGAGGELILPIFLILGLFSRPAALCLFFVNLMAVLSYPALWTFECPAAINDHFYWGVLLLSLSIFGAGKLSMDEWLQMRWNRRVE
jgi:putative oxidoreductase